MKTVKLNRFGSRLLTREKARLIAADLPTHSPLRLDLSDVEATSPSFLDELLLQAFRRGIQSVSLANASESVRMTLDLLRDQPVRSGYERAKADPVDV